MKWKEITNKVVSFCKLWWRISDWKEEQQILEIWKHKFLSGWISFFRIVMSRCKIEGYLTWEESCYSSFHTCYSDQLFFVNRCNCVSLFDGISDHAAARAWEQRWVRACVCGGRWRKLPFKEQQNVAAAATSTSSAAAAATGTPAVSVASQ